MVNIPGHTLISNHRKNSKGGGTGLLIRNCITYKCRPDLDVFYEKITESGFVEVVAKCGKQIVVGSQRTLYWI